MPEANTPAFQRYPTPINPEFEKKQNQSFSEIKNKCINGSAAKHNQTQPVPQIHTATSEIRTEMRQPFAEIEKKMNHNLPDYYQHLTTSLPEAALFQKQVPIERPPFQITQKPITRSLQPSHSPAISNREIRSLPKKI